MKLRNRRPGSSPLPQLMKAHAPLHKSPSVDSTLSVSVSSCLYLSPWFMHTSNPKQPLVLTSYFHSTSFSTDCLGLKCERDTRSIVEYWWGLLRVEVRVVRRCPRLSPDVRELSNFSKLSLLMCAARAHGDTHDRTTHTRAEYDFLT